MTSVKQPLGACFWPLAEPARLSVARQVSHWQMGRPPPISTVGRLSRLEI